MRRRTEEYRVNDRAGYINWIGREGVNKLCTHLQELWLLNDNSNDCNCIVKTEPQKAIWAFLFQKKTAANLIKQCHSNAWKNSNGCWQDLCENEINLP